jgi:copper chaperone
MSMTTLTSTYLIAGMTCDHCVAAVRDEIGNLSMVTGVEVDLVPGGTVTSTGAPAEEQVRAAVEEAGYALVEDSR